MPRYPGLTLRVLGRDQPALGPGKAALLDHIVRTGSISAAARAMGMSYRRAWQLVEALNRSFVEPVVLTKVGGGRGGGAVVTAFGRDLARRFHVMEDKASAAIAEDLEDLFRRLKRRPAHRPARPSRRGG